MFSLCFASFVLFLSFGVFYECVCGFDFLCEKIFSFFFSSTSTGVWPCCTCWSKPRVRIARMIPWKRAKKQNGKIGSADHLDVKITNLYSLLESVSKQESSFELERTGSYCWVNRKVCLSSLHFKYPTQSRNLR